MNIVDVYDIATSEWYTQSTSGQFPKYRVNPCAVIAAAQDGSSYNIYMFGELVDCISYQAATDIGLTRWPKPHPIRQPDTV